MSGTTTTGRVKLSLFVGAGLAVALILAFAASPRASDKPDGLNKVAIDQGFDDQETAHGLGDGPLAGYGVKGIDDDGLSTGLAGVVGVVTTFAVGLGFFGLVRLGQRSRDRQSSGQSRSGPSPSGPSSSGPSPSGPSPSGLSPSGQSPSGQSPSGQSPSGPSPSGPSPSGPSPSGPSPSGRLSAPQSPERRSESAETRAQSTTPASS